MYYSRVDERDPILHEVPTPNRKSAVNYCLQRSIAIVMKPMQHSSPCIDLTGTMDSSGSRPACVDSCRVKAYMHSSQETLMFLSHAKGLRRGMMVRFYWVDHSANSELGCRVEEQMIKMILKPNSAMT